MAGQYYKFNHLSGHGADRSQMVYCTVLEPARAAAKKRARASVILLAAGTRPCVYHGYICETDDGTYRSAAVPTAKSAAFSSGTNSRQFVTLLIGVEEKERG